MLKHETIFLIVGKSGSGKTTLCDRLCQEYNLTQLWSYTTRPARHIDEPGHHFVSSMEHWKRCRPNENIVAYTNFSGHDYWATDVQVDGSDLYVIDPDGVEYFRKSYRGSKDIVVIYIDVPLWTRVRRMRQRGDGLRNAMKRAWNDIKKFGWFVDKADFVVDNDRIGDAVQAIWDIMYEVDGNKNKPYEGKNIPVERVEWRNANG